MPNGRWFNSERSASAATLTLTLTSTAAPSSVSRLVRAIPRLHAVETWPSMSTNFVSIAPKLLAILVGKARVVRFARSRCLLEKIERLRLSQPPMLHVSVQELNC